MSMRCHQSLMAAKKKALCCGVGETDQFCARPRPFIGENDIHVDPNFPKIKLEVKPKPVEDIKTAGEEEIDSSQDKDGIANDNPERSITIKEDIPLEDKTECKDKLEEEVIHLRAEVKSLQQAVEDQGSLILKLNALVKKHDAMLNENYSLEDGKKGVIAKCFNEVDSCDKNLGDESSSLPTSREDEAAAGRNESGLSLFRRESLSVTSDSDDAHDPNSSKKDVLHGKWHKGRKHGRKADHEITPYCDWRHHAKYRTAAAKSGCKYWPIFENQHCEKREQPKQSHLYKWRRGSSRGRRFQRSHHESFDPHIQKLDSTKLQFKSNDKPTIRRYKRKSGQGNHDKELDQVRRTFMKNRRMGRHSKVPERISEEGNQDDVQYVEPDICQCPDCPRSCRAQEDLEANAQSNSMFSCSICGQTYFFQESLRRHLDDKHDIQQEDSN